MASRKYLGDYRLENVESNGKLKTVAVYRGKEYGFTAKEALRNGKKRLTALAASFWLAQFAALMVRTSCAHYIYVIMPMVFAMLPFWFASLGLYSALTALKASDGTGQAMKREQAEKLESRFAGGSLIAAFLSGASFFGSFIAFIASGTSPSGGDIVFVLCTAVQAAAAALCFSERAAFKTGPLPGKAGGTAAGADNEASDGRL